MKQLSVKTMLLEEIAEGVKEIRGTMEAFEAGRVYEKKQQTLNRHAEIREWRRR